MINLFENKVTRSSRYREIIHSFFYKKTEDLIINKEDCLVVNSDASKAISMLIGVFRNSDTVHLFTNNEKSDVSNNEDYEFAVKSFLYRKGKIFLVVKNKIELEKAYKIYSLLYKYAHERPNLVKIAVADDLFKDQVKNKFEQMNNFCVGNHRFVRVEHDTKNFYAKASDDEIQGEILSKMIENCIRRNNILNTTKIKNYSYSV